MQKYSHTSRRVQKELGGDVYALSGRVDTIEEDVARLEGYEEHEVKHFMFDIAHAEEKTLQAVLENTEVMDWLAGTHKNDWTSFTIAGTGNTTLDGRYGHNSGGFSTQDYTGSILKYKQFAATQGFILAAAEKTLKADTSTGALSYGSTNLNISGGYTLVNISFTKGVLKS